MWSVDFAKDEYGAPVGKNRFTFFQRKHPDAMDLLRVRVQMILTAINAGKPIAEIMRQGFIHMEPSGVFAVSPGKPPLRLYCCLDSRRRMLLMLTIGDKRQQGDDIKTAVGWAKEIREE